MSISLLRHTLILTKLQKQPATRKEIEAYLERESELRDIDLSVDRRTLTRDLNSILSNYGIEIKYDQSAKIYRIINDNQAAAGSRLLEAFHTLNAMSAAESFSKYIHFEQRRPPDTEYLQGLLRAIKERRQVNFSYQKYWDEEPNHRKAQPYALKEFKSRWYLLANDLTDDVIKSFALDRLTDLNITKKTFKANLVYDAEAAYRHSFGIMAPNAPEPTEIILAFDPHQGKYIKSLPLHHSQELLADTEDELRIKLTLYITRDFIMELLSHGEDVTVLKPEILPSKTRWLIIFELQKTS